MSGDPCGTEDWVEAHFAAWRHWTIRQNGRGRKHRFREYVVKYGTTPLLEPKGLPEPDLGPRRPAQEVFSEAPLDMTDLELALHDPRRLPHLEGDEYPLEFTPEDVARGLDLVPLAWEAWQLADQDGMEVRRAALLVALGRASRRRSSGDPAVERDAEAIRKLVDQLQTWAKKD